MLSDNLLSPAQAGFALDSRELQPDGKGEYRIKCSIFIGLFRVFIFWYHERRFASTIGRDTTMNVIQALKTIPDPRSRRGRHYPLFGLLAIVLRAAMHGERS